MRPLQIRIKGFGPYREEQSVDFSAMDGLFLISGPTGSGKTAILDAMTYALYGVSSGGNRGEIEKLRSQYAEEGEAAFVELRLRQRGKEYLFRREMRDASGRKTSYLCGRISGGVVEPIAPRITKKAIAEYAEAVTGLNANQFCQVAVLPQGKFERLLLAKSDEKNALMRTLFGTEIWDKATRRMGEALSAEREALAIQEARLREIFSREGVEDMPAMEAMRAQAEAEMRAAAEELEDANGQIAGLEEAIALAAALARDFDGLAEAERELAALEKQAGVAAEQEIRLRRGEAAAAVRPFAAQMEQAKGSFAGRETDWKKAAGALAAAEAAQAQATRQVQAAAAGQEALAGLRRELARMEAAVGEETPAQLPAAIEALSGHALAEALAEAEQALAAVDGEALAEEMRRMERQEILYAQAKKTVEQMERLRQDGKAGRAALNRATAQAAEIEQTLAEADAAYASASAAYFGRAAQRLAEKLVEGEPCPVCGSRTHIAPQRAASQQQGEDPDVALARRQKAAAQLTRAQGEEARCREAVASMLERYKGYQQELMQTLGGAAYDPQQAGEISRRLAELREQADALPALRARQRALAAKWAGELRQEIAGLERQAARAGAAQGEAAAARSAAQALLEKCAQERDAAGEIVQKAAAELAVALEAHGFADVEEYSAASMEQAALVEARAAVQEHARRMDVATRARDRLAEKLRQMEKPDMDALRARLGEARGQAEAQAAARAQWEQTAARLGREMETAGVLQKKCTEERARFAARRAFLERVRGDRGVSIGRYVMGVMLSAVAAQANRLLEEVHNGRYRLFRTDEAGGRAHKAGLELMVYDGYSGGRRGVETLSGGEKFLLSLALSLGLAAVVGEQAGGVPIDCMFIDEGFGTLDGDSLDDALDMLRSVRQTRTLVGVISHVEALRESIAAVVEVSKSTSGSRIATHF